MFEAIETEEKSPLKHLRIVTSESSRLLTFLS